MQTRTILALIGGFVVIVVATFGATGLYAYNVYKDAPSITLADFELGGTQSPAERTALIESCTSGFGTEESCGCLADKAVTELSRFERLLTTATFSQSATKMMQVVTAAAVADIPDDKVEKSTETMQTRLAPVMQACGWNG